MFGEGRGARGAGGGGMAGGRLGDNGGEAGGGGDGMKLCSTLALTLSDTGTLPLT